MFLRAHLQRGAASAAALFSTFAMLVLGKGKLQTAQGWEQAAQGAGHIKSRSKAGMLAAASTGAPLKSANAF